MIRTLRAMTLAAVCMAAASAGAQDIRTYNDTVRRNTWTVTVGGGVSGTSMPKAADTGTHLRLGPEGFLGVKYYITPMWRLALNAGYIYSRNFNENITTTTTTEDGFMVGDHSTTLITNGARLDNTWKGHNYYADLTINWNFLDLWHYRKAQKWNLWLGAGVGYLYSDWTDGQMWAYDANALAQGDTYFNVYNHSWLNANDKGHYVNSLYIPMKLELEYDITPRWTVGAYGQAKWLPNNVNTMPKWFWGAGLTLSYNFLGKKMPTSKQKYEDALARLNQLQRDCDERNAALDKALQDQDKLNKQLRGENDDLQKKLKEQQAAARKTDHVVYFPCNKTFLTGEEMLRLDKFAAQMKQNPDLKLEIVGEASSDGVVEKNQTLSEGRLKTVIDYLTNQGVDASRIVTTSAIGDTKAEPKAEYRRVSISTK